MVAAFLPQLQRLIYGNITVICLVIIIGYIVQRSNSCNIVGTSIQITLSNYSCLNTTTITMTCATYNSDALVWIVGQDVKSFLLRAANAIQYFDSTYSGVNCTAYRRLVNVTNQIIESEMICKIIGGLSYPLHFVCKSNDDNADYCSSLLETIHCYDDMIGVHYVANKGQENQTSVNSIQIKAIVIPGAVVGAGAIVIFICVGLLYLSLRRKNARKDPQNATECSEGTHDTPSETIGLPSTQPKRQAVTHKTRGGQSGDPQCLPMRNLIDGFSEQNTLSAQDEKSNGPVTDNTVEESVKCLVEEALPASRALLSRQAMLRDCLRKTHFPPTPHPASKRKYPPLYLLLGHLLNRSAGDYIKDFSLKDAVTPQSLVALPVHQSTLSIGIDRQCFRPLLEASTPFNKACLCTVPQESSWLSVVPTEEFDPHKMDSADGMMESGTAQSISVTALQHESESAQNASVTALQHTRYSTSQNTMNEAFLTPLHKPASSHPTKWIMIPLVNPLLVIPLVNPLLVIPLFNPLLVIPLFNPLLAIPLVNPLLVIRLVNPLLVLK
eukprot:Em0006g206a